MVQWLRLQALSAGVVDSFPGEGTKRGLTSPKRKKKCQKQANTLTKAPDH